MFLPEIFSNHIYYSFKEIITENMEFQIKKGNQNNYLNCFYYPPELLPVTTGLTALR
jgi:hypothetical protein